MKFYTHLKYLTITIVAAIALSACNDIDRDDRFIELPAIEAKRVVLLEEFTGQMCINCPAAHEVIAGLLAQYPDNLIPVSIHGGGDAFSFSEDKMPGVGLRNEEGQSYCDEYKIASLPAAVVNRTSGVLNSDQWASMIRSEIAKPSVLDMEVDAQLNADGNKVTITVAVSPYQNISGYLQLWAVESNITSVQITPNGFKADYVHNHVFRGSLNGHKGERVVLKPRTPETFTVTADLKSHWNPQNLSIIAFIYDDSGVLQATHKAL